MLRRQSPRARRGAGIAFVTALALLTGVVPETARADIITQNTAGTTGANTFFPGQSLTTPGGGPWDHITFNFFSDVPATTPTAAGTLFLLSQEYLGTPADLSSSTPGFLAQSQSISGGMYIFDPSIALQPNTQYFFYANASFLNSGGNTVPGGNVYFTFSATSPFVGSNVSSNHRLSGTPAHEPSGAILASIGILAGLGSAWRCRTARRAASGQPS
jgi:hypothetical protein